MSISKRYTIKQRKALKKKAWTLYASWIRARDGNICVTCGKSLKDGYRMNAGHYIHKREDFNPQNVHCQCFVCNKIKKGNMRYYTIFMIKQYGVDFVESLLKKESEPIKLESAEFYLSVISVYSHLLKQQS